MKMKPLCGVPSPTASGCCDGCPSIELHNNNKKPSLGRSMCYVSIYIMHILLDQIVSQSYDNVHFVRHVCCVPPHRQLPEVPLYAVRNSDPAGLLAVQSHIRKRYLGSRQLVSPSSATEARANSSRNSSHTCSVLSSLNFLICLNAV